MNPFITQHMRITLLLTFLLTGALSSPAFAATVTWVGTYGVDGAWATGSNWSTGNAPAITDDITIDCGCSVTVSADLSIDGSLSIASGTTFEMGTNLLTIGGATDASAKTATLDNYGTINAAEIKVKGDKFSSTPKNGTYLGDGPYLNNYGTLTGAKFSVGNNNGGGKLTNAATGTITSDGDWHVDGTLTNLGIINVDAAKVLFHGAVVDGGGSFNVKSNLTVIEMKANPEIGAAGAGLGADVQDQAFALIGGGCTGANDTDLMYKVDGDEYTYDELLEAFGVTDIVNFSVDPNLVSSCGAAPLPIELLYFKAKTNDQSEVTLFWATATETDNDYFVVERSRNGTDWEELYQESGAGNSTIVLNYSMLDKNPYKGISYYQLKQVDFDGAYSYSPVIAVSIKFDSNVDIHPNPIINQFTIMGESVEDSEITMTNMMGQAVPISITKSINKSFIQTATLDKGVYLVTINRNGIVEIKKLLVV